MCKPAHGADSTYYQHQQPEHQVTVPLHTVVSNRDVRTREFDSALTEALSVFDRELSKRGIHAVDGSRLIDGLTQQGRVSRADIQEALDTIARREAERY